MSWVRLASWALGALVLAGTRPGAAATAEECRAFHRECAEARAAGYHDVGICNVERLECATEPTAGVAEPPPRPKDDRAHDPEGADRERSVGP